MKQIVFLLSFVVITQFSYAQIGFKIAPKEPPTEAMDGGAVETNLKVLKVEKENLKKELVDEDSLNPLLFNAWEKALNDEETEDNVSAKKTSYLNSLAKINKLKVDIRGKRKEINEYKFDSRGRSFMNFSSFYTDRFFDTMYSEGENLNYLQDVGVNFGHDTGSIYTEIVSTRLLVFRVSFGTMVASNNDEDQNVATQEESLRMLSTNGGNTSLTFEYPLAYLQLDENRFKAVLLTKFKGNADLEGFGTSQDGFAASFSSTISGYVDYVTKDDKLRFFVFGNWGWFSGNNIFRDNLGVNEPNFTFGQLTAGIAVLDTLKISFIIGSVSNEDMLRNGRVVYSGSILPN